jgi:hypothetical protein
MQTRPALKVLGTLLFLYGVFGYIFPHWGKVVFTNNENLFHVLTGVGAILFASATPPRRKITLFALALLYLGLGIYAFTIKHPMDFHIKNISAQLDEVDNYIHIIIGLTFAWFWLGSRK